MSSGKGNLESGAFVHTEGRVVPAEYIEEYNPCSASAKAVDLRFHLDMRKNRSAEGTACF